VKQKGSAVDALNHRFRRRMSAGVLSEKILSNAIYEYCQMVRKDPGELKSRKQEKKLFAKRGAPFGNTNRLKHGGYTNEMKQLRAHVRDHLRRARAHLDSIRTHSKRVSSD
jgi:hypothetical protein